MPDTQKRMDELMGFIEDQNRHYYDEDAPRVSDFEYDRAMQELLALEEANPELAREDSPTQRVGGKPSDAFSKVRYDRPKLSLADAFSRESSWISISGCARSAPRSSTVWKTNLTASPWS